MLKNRTFKLLLIGLVLAIVAIFFQNAFAKVSDPTAVDHTFHTPPMSDYKPVDHTFHTPPMSDYKPVDHTFHTPPMSDYNP
ncbi:MAG: hypothetical protein HS100_09110 [Anaerolineales bacterium]|nr:hypothetical protein [Anaerolineales bacterium]